MATTTILWAGKPLSTAEEIGLRRAVHTMRRIGDDDLAADFERFLPEHEGSWTPDELTAGAELGPSLGVDARLHDDGPAVRDSA